MQTLTIYYSGREFTVQVPSGTSDAEILAALAENFPELNGGRITRDGSGRLTPRPADSKNG